MQHENETQGSLLRLNTEMILFSKTVIPQERNEVNEGHKITGNGGPIHQARLVPSPLRTYGELDK